MEDIESIVKMDYEFIKIRNTDGKLRIHEFKSFNKERIDSVMIESNMAVGKLKVIHFIDSVREDVFKSSYVLDELLSDGNSQHDL